MSLHLNVCAGARLPQVIRGGNGLADGPVDNATLQKAMKRVAEGGFLHEPQEAPAEEGPPLKLARHRYAAMYGPTTGDKVQLGNTCLTLEASDDAFFPDTWLWSLL